MLASALSAADYYISNTNGNDNADGRHYDVIDQKQGPWRTAARALLKVRGGDTLHFIDTGKPYRQQIIINNIKGKPDKPLIIDGHNNVFDGADLCPSDAWQAGEAGLWYQDACQAVHLMQIDGAIVPESVYADKLKPGEYCYEYASHDFAVFMRLPEGAELEQYLIQALLPDGSLITLETTGWQSKGALWRYERIIRPQKLLLNNQAVIEKIPRDYLNEGDWCREESNVYYKPKAGVQPGTQQIYGIVRDNGIVVNGDSAHLEIRNFNVQNVWNDGYNIHGSVKDTVFSNCNARYCFDEGFSAHDDCETVLDNAVFRDCGSGVFNVNQTGYSITRNLTVINCGSRGYGARYSNGRAWHTLENVLLINNPIQMDIAWVDARNILIIDGGRKNIGMQLIGPCGLSHITVFEYSDQLRTRPGRMPIVFEKSVFIGKGKWRLGNAVESESLQLEEVYVHPESSVVYKSELKNLIAAFKVTGKHGRLLSCVNPDELRFNNNWPGPGCSPDLWERYFALMGSLIAPE